MKITISAIILSHNDEATIGKTLKSLFWCDERIVIDDDSRDKTRDVAKKYKTTIYQHTLDGDFAAQRNFGLSNAKGDWVLFVDSDEVVSEELAKEIASSMTPRNDKINGYFINRKDYFLGKWLTHGETSKVKLLRLAMKDAGVWVRPVHEVWNISGCVGELDSPLLHYPHPSVAQFLDEINFYSSLNAQYLYNQNVHSPWWRMIVNPIAKFLYNYVYRLGFLDCTPGAMVALMMSFHSFLTRAKLYMLRHPHD